VFLVEVRDRNLYKLRFIPVVLNYAQVDLAKGEEFTAICHRMKSLCAPCDTQIMQTAAGLEVKLRNERWKAISKSFQPSFYGECQMDNIILDFKL